MIKCHYIIMFLVLFVFIICESDYENNCKGNATTKKDCFNKIKNYNKPNDFYCCFYRKEMTDLNISECQIITKDEYDNMKDFFKNFEKDNDFKKLSIDCGLEDDYSSNEEDEPFVCESIKPLNEYDCFEKMTKNQKAHGYRCCYYEVKGYIVSDENKELLSDYKFCTLLSYDMYNEYQNDLSINKERGIDMILHCDFDKSKSNYEDKDEDNYKDNDSDKDNDIDKDNKHYNFNVNIYFLLLIIINIL